MNSTGPLGPLVKKLFGLVIVQIIRGTLKGAEKYHMCRKRSKMSKEVSLISYFEFHYISCLTTLHQIKKNRVQNIFNSWHLFWFPYVTFIIQLLSLYSKLSFQRSYIVTNRYILPKSWNLSQSKHVSCCEESNFLFFSVGIIKVKTTL